MGPERQHHVFRISVGHWSFIQNPDRYILSTFMVELEIREFSSGTEILEGASLGHCPLLIKRADKPFLPIIDRKMIDMLLRCR